MNRLVNKISLASGGFNASTFKMKNDACDQSMRISEERETDNFL